ncbi:MAG: hypothetical protein WCJ37_01155 [Syntrophus sp. (in: bacteria)]
MSMDNKTENDALLMFLKGTDPAYRTDATQYIALLTGAGAPSEATPIATECTYTGYARVPITKASGWDDNGSSFTNLGTLTFGARSDDGATQTAYWFAVVDTGPVKATAVNMCIIGELSTPLAISQKIQPIFAIGDLEVTAD